MMKKNTLHSILFLPFTIAVISLGITSCNSIKSNIKVDQGNTAFENQNYEKAAQLYEEAIELGISGKDLADVYAKLGLSYDELERYDEAISAYRKSLEFNPDSPEVWVNLGIVYRLTDDYQQALICYEKALEIDPEYAEAYSSIGTLLVLQGDAQTAISYFERAIEISPTLAVSHGNLALAYAMVGRFDDAESALRQAIALGYENAEIIRERIENLK